MAISATLVYRFAHALNSKHFARNKNTCPKRTRISCSTVVTHHQLVLAVSLAGAAYKAKRSENWLRRRGISFLLLYSPVRYLTSESPKQAVDSTAVASVANVCGTQPPLSCGPVHRTQQSKHSHTKYFTLPRRIESESTSKNGECETLCIHIRTCC